MKHFMGWAVALTAVAGICVLLHKKII